MVKLIPLTRFTPHGIADKIILVKTIQYLRDDFHGDESSRVDTNSGVKAECRNYCVAISHGGDPFRFSSGIPAFVGAGGANASCTDRATVSVRSESSVPSASSVGQPCRMQRKLMTPLNQYCCQKMGLEIVFVCQAVHHLCCLLVNLLRRSRGGRIMLLSIQSLQPLHLLSVCIQYAICDIGCGIRPHGQVILVVLLVGEYVMGAPVMNWK
jgi:hypothetical protein